MRESCAFITWLHQANIPAVSIFLYLLSTAFASCGNPAITHEKEQVEWAASNTLGEIVSGIGSDIGHMYQDQQGRYWFASNSRGVYCYDGKQLLNYTQKDGLCSDFVRKIGEDRNGVLWFTTGDGVCTFDGMRFRNQTRTINSALPGILKPANTGLFFNSGGGVCYTDGESFMRFQIHPATYTPSPDDNSRPYAVYSTFVDKQGDAWFGTQSQGVCRYNGVAFSYLSDLDLAGPAVRCIFQDKSGVMWFGNNGGGLFRYDGRKLRNITREKGLENLVFLEEGRPVDKPASMARVFAINEDKAGNLWIGTIDAGLWKYDGINLTNYTAEDGLPGNSIWCIHKDNSGELWFVVDGKAIVSFDGKGFKDFKF